MLKPAKTWHKKIHGQIGILHGHQRRRSQYESTPDKTFHLNWWNWVVWKHKDISKVWPIEGYRTTKNHPKTHPKIRWKSLRQICKKIAENPQQQSIIASNVPGVVVHCWAAWIEMVENRPCPECWFQSQAILLKKTSSCWIHTDS